MSFSNKVVIITGAGSGIGEAIALHFAKLSANLYLIDKDKENLYKVAEKCENFNTSKILKAVIDVSNDDDLKKSIESVIREFHRIDVLINCAGIALTGLITDPDVLNTLDKMMSINLRAIFAATHFAAPSLIENRGCIINISSILGSFTMHNSVTYSISKAAVTHLTKCVAMELAEYGVRVNCISPGAIDTNLIINSGKTPEQNKIINNMTLKQLPLKRMVKVEDVAEMAGFLASDKAASITGANMFIDSGFTVASCLRLSEKS